MPSDTDFEPGIASTLPLEVLFTQNIRILEAVFLRYIGVPKPLSRCPDGAKLLSWEVIDLQEYIALGSVPNSSRPLKGAGLLGDLL